MLKLKISTKVEFGIIAVIDIASHSLNGNAVTTPEIAKRQNISKKYLEQILLVTQLGRTCARSKGFKRRLCYCKKP